MDDRDLTEALGALGLDRSTYAAVALLPLVEVAWADGRVQRAERDLIAEIAQRYGLLPDDAWLKRWLDRRPAPTTFLAARTVLLALMSRAGRDDVRSPETLESLLDLCMAVAEAAGGLFGIAFTVERTERECIEEIAASLALGPALPDVVVRAWHTTVKRGISDDPTSIHRRPRRPASVPTARFARPVAPGSDAPTAPPDSVPPAPQADPEAYVEDDPTVPYMDDLKAALSGTYVLDDVDEE